MTLWDGERRNSWASNGNISIYIFFLLFIVWVGFQVWSRIDDIPAPAALDPMVMAALGVAITTKSVEKRKQEKDAQSQLDEFKQILEDSKKRVEDQ